MLGVETYGLNFSFYFVSILIFKVFGNNIFPVNEFVLMSKQGEWKQYPETGCDIAKAQFGSINVLLDRNIRVQMQADGFNIEKLKITETGIEINGKYS